AGVDLRQVEIAGQLERVDHALAQRRGVETQLGELLHPHGRGTQGTQKAAAPPDVLVETRDLLVEHAVDVAQLEQLHVQQLEDVQDVLMVLAIVYQRDVPIGRD